MVNQLILATFIVFQLKLIEAIWQQICPENMTLISIQVTKLENGRHYYTNGATRKQQSESLPLT